MAEALAHQTAQNRGQPALCRSGGVMGLRDKPAAANAVAVLAEQNLDISGHRSSGIYSEDIDWADYILVMETRHAIKLRGRYSRSGDKILELAPFGGLTTIKDPIGGWKFRFRQCRRDLQRCIDAFFDQLPPRL